MHLLIFYFFLVNIVAFISMLRDKLAAKHRKSRTPELVLLGFAILGGALGAFLGMHIYHHKTLHKKFTVTLPILAFLQVVIFIFCLFSINFNPAAQLLFL